MRESHPFCTELRRAMHLVIHGGLSTQAVREAATICPRPLLTFDLFILKLVSESRMTWATSVPNLIFLGLYVLDLGPLYATDRQTSDRVRRQTASLLNAPAQGPGAGHNNAIRGGEKM